MAHLRRELWQVGGGVKTPISPILPHCPLPILPVSNHKTQKITHYQSAPLFSLLIVRQLSTTTHQPLPICTFNSYPNPSVTSPLPNEE
ncbi:hypothetical protein ACTXT7_007556 [Hymenolepis weldensis]